MVKRCFCCEKVISEEEIMLINRKFERASEDLFLFFIDILGLTCCTGTEEKFFEGTANVCQSCYNLSLKVYNQEFIIK